MKDEADMTFVNTARNFSLRDAIVRSHLRSVRASACEPNGGSGERKTEYVGECVATGNC